MCSNKVHMFGYNGELLCRVSCYIDDTIITNDWSKVTCLNCLKFLRREKRKCRNCKCEVVG